METADYEEVTKVDLVEPFIVASKNILMILKPMMQKLKICGTLMHTLIFYRVLKSRSEFIENIKEAA